MIRCWQSWTSLGLGTIQTSSSPADCTKQLLLQARQLLVKNTLGRGLSRDLCVSFGLGLHLFWAKQLLLQTRQFLVNTTLGLGVGIDLGVVCSWPSSCLHKTIAHISQHRQHRRWCLFSRRCTF